jgi:hypothetical protein
MGSFLHVGMKRTKGGENYGVKTYYDTTVRSGMGKGISNSTLIICINLKHS